MYFLLFLRGEVDAGAATVGLAATVFGTCVGTFAYAAVLDAFPIKGYDGIVAVKATGGVYHGAAAEVGERHPSLRKRCDACSNTSDSARRLFVVKRSSEWRPTARASVAQCLIRRPST